jgi:hypothetical protein
MVESSSAIAGGAIVGDVAAELLEFVIDEAGCWAALCFASHDSFTTRCSKVFASLS